MIPEPSAYDDAARARRVTEPAKRGAVGERTQQRSPFARDRARILHSGVGGITESDVTLAAASGAPIIGFNVRANAKAREIAERQKVALKYYDVIYDLIDEIRAGMAGALGPEAFETVVGRAEIREVFRSSKWGNIAGAYITKGVVKRNAKARLVRDGSVVKDSLTIDSLRRFKDDATEVREGFECGIGLGSFNDIQEGDMIETWEMREKPRA